MAKTHITIPVFIPHQGCAHRCVFCNQCVTTATHGPPPPDRIDELVNEYKRNIKKSVMNVDLAFFGGSFTGMSPEIQKAYLARAARHLKMGSIQGIRVSTRPDCISAEAVHNLVSYGVSTIELGVQSFDGDVLRAAKRGHGPEETFRAIETIRKLGVDFVIQLMPGLPMETRSSAIRSAQIAADLEPSATRIYPVVVIRNTLLERLYRNGEFTPLEMEDAIELCKEMYQIFKSRAIPVIRMGLHPFAPENRDAIIAGPYHESFGHLVKSRARRDEMLRRAGELLARHDGAARAIRFLIPHPHKEEYIGNRKENIDFIRRHFGLDRVDYAVVDAPRVSVLYAC
ncbi:MAG: radical SAM protein [Chrysiogenales bacterium]|nr:MAG: radical SAM protein [Chrysiogenales bacterium]